MAVDFTTAALKADGHHNVDHNNRLTDWTLRSTDHLQRLAVNNFELNLLFSGLNSLLHSKKAASQAAHGRCMVAGTVKLN